MRPMIPASEHDSTWLTRVVSRGHGDGPGHLTLSGFAMAASVPLVLLTASLGLLRDTIGVADVGTQLLVAILVVVGPAFIWYYEARLYPSFIERMAGVVADPDELAATADRYHTLFTDKYGYVVVLWASFLLGTCLLNIGYFTSLGVTSYTDPAFLLYLLFVLWAALVTGLGLHLAVVSVLLIHQIGTLDLVIDPRHPDGFGGLSAIGDFTIWTTVLFSIGSLGFPLAFAMAAEGGYSAAVYTIVAIYIGTLLLSFVYPTVYINRRADDARYDILEAKRAEIEALLDDILAAPPDAADEIETLSTQLDILKAEFRVHQNVTLYPFSVGILTRLASSVLLPLLFLALQLQFG